MSLLWKTAIEHEPEFGKEYDMPIQKALDLPSEDYGGRARNALKGMQREWKASQPGGPMAHETRRRSWEDHGGPRGYIDHLKDQIERTGYVEEPLEIRGGRLWDGHHRLLAAHELGHTHVPVVHKDEEDEW